MKEKETQQKLENASQKVKSRLTAPVDLSKNAAFANEKFDDDKQGDKV